MLIKCGPRRVDEIDFDSNGGKQLINFRVDVQYLKNEICNMERSYQGASFSHYNFCTRFDQNFCVSPLMWAASKGMPRAVARLLELGAEVDGYHFVGKRTALSYANGEMGFEDLITKDIFGNRIFPKGKHYQCVKILLEAGANKELLEHPSGRVAKIEDEVQKIRGSVKNRRQNLEILQSQIRKGIRKKEENQKRLQEIKKRTHLAYKRHDKVNNKGAGIGL